MTSIKDVLEDDYAPATRSLVPTLVSLLALLAIVAVLVWWLRRA